MKIKPVLKATDVKLIAYGGASITLIGTCQLLCTGKGQQCNIKFYIVPVDANPILGLSACTKLGLIKRVETIQTLSGMSKVE